MRTHADIAGSAKGAMQGVVGVQGFCQGDGEGRLGRAREMWTGNASGRWRRPMWQAITVALEQKGTLLPGVAGHVEHPAKLVKRRATR